MKLGWLNQSVALFACALLLGGCSALAQSVVCMGEAVNPDTFDGEHLCHQQQAAENQVD